MTRKVVQILISGEKIYSLCDDGSMWHGVIPDNSEFTDCNNPYWQLIENIPQFKIHKEDAANYSSH